jgi:Acetyltransferase (GNAT) family
MADSGLSIPPFGDYIFVPGRCLSEGDLLRFAVTARTGADERLLRRWWRRADPACAVAAIHAPTASLAGLCCGRPGQWQIAGQAVPSLAICDWYVGPAHAGRGLGKRMVEAFAASDRLLYAYAISEAAAVNFKKLGWLGPHAASLLVLPLPGVQLARPAAAEPPGVILQEHTAASEPELRPLCAFLESVDAADARAARMLRDGQEWSWRLAVGAPRSYRFAVLQRHSTPVGYVALRRVSRRLFGVLPTAAITDFIAVDDEEMVLHRLAVAARKIATDLRVWLLIAATSRMPHRRALRRAGFLSTRVPLLGRLPGPRDPAFMWAPHGPGSQLTAPAVSLSLSESDLDLNL